MSLRRGGVVVAGLGVVLALGSWLRRRTPTGRFGDGTPDVTSNWSPVRRLEPSLAEARRMR